MKHVFLLNYFSLKDDTEKVIKRIQEVADDMELDYRLEVNSPYRSTEKILSNYKDHEDIIIGATGNYYADEIRPVYGIYFIKDDMNITEYPISPEGTLAYQYKVPIRNSFDSIADIEIDIGANKQFIGPIENLISFLDCTKEQVTKVSMSRYFKIPVEYLFYQGQDLIDFSENAFMPGYINNFKSLVSAYENKLY